MSTLTASSAPLDSAVALAVQSRLCSCAEFNGDLVKTHRRLLMQLASARDTVTWEVVVDASPALVWDAAAGSMESYFAHLNHAGSVQRLEGGSTEAGARYLIQGGVTGVAGGRLCEVLVSVPGRMLAVSDVDPVHPGGVGTLPTLRGISLRADDEKPGRSVVTLTSVTAGTYQMWQLPLLMAQAESIRNCVASMNGFQPSGNVFRINVVRAHSSESSSASDESILRMRSTRTFNNTTHTAMTQYPGKRSAVSRFSRWIIRVAALSLFVTVAAVAGVPRFDLAEVYDLVEHRGPYQYDHRYSRIYLMDEATDRVQISVTLDADGTLKLYGIIGRVERMERSDKEDLMRTIEVFNFHSAVGTMSYDEATGEIRITRRVTASEMTPAAAATRVVEFTDIVRAESMKFAEARESGDSYCTIRCKRG